MCRLSWNLGASTSWFPQGLSRPVMGLLYLFTGPWSTTLHENITVAHLVKKSVISYAIWRFITMFTHLPLVRALSQTQSTPSQTFQLKLSSAKNSWVEKAIRSTYTGLFKMIVGVLRTCHTQYTWDRSICIFYFTEQHSEFLWHTLQVLYIRTLCDYTNINTKIEFIPDCL